MSARVLAPEPPVAKPREVFQQSLTVGKEQDPAEREAARWADAALFTNSQRTGLPRSARMESGDGSDPASEAIAPPSVSQMLAREGNPLPSAVRIGMENLFAHDFSSVKIHADATAAASTREVRAAAYTAGHHIVFGQDRFNPYSTSGRRLLAHELAHVVQQSQASTLYVARSVEDWLMGSVDVTALTYTRLVDEADEIAQYLSRQTSSSPETAVLEETLAALRREIGRRETATTERPRRRGRRGDRERRPASSSDALPARYPRVLIEMTSVAYSDPAEMRAEYDLIMQWLARPDISAGERSILTAERDNLAPQLRADRERVSVERHAARVRSALSPADEEDSRALEALARTIEGISDDPGNPQVSYIYDQGERIAISSEQAGQLRADLLRELGRAGRSVQSRASYYWERYNSQLAINRDSPIIAGISGWLADVEDPGDELRVRYFQLSQRMRSFESLLRDGRTVEAAAILPRAEVTAQEIWQLARAFYEGYIEGAEIAVNRLEFTRDASFAIAGSIAAVVAAPVVAGYVAGAGFTGATATALTVGGTGVTVGTGAGIVRGTSAAGGELLAGGSWTQALSSFRGEFVRGFREGFVAGAAGGAARLLGVAAGASASVSEQVFIRVAGDFVVNSTATMLDALWQSCSAGHCDVDQAVRLGIASGVASLPGSIVGLSNSQIARNFLAPLTAGATTYASAVHAGATPEEALRSAGVAVSTNLAMSHAAHGADTDVALYEHGRSMGASTRETATYATRRVASTSAAVMIGVSEALPPLRSGYGGSPVVVETDVGLPPISQSMPAPLPADVAPATALTAPTDAPDGSTSTTAAPHVEVEPTAPASTAPASASADDLNIDASLAVGAPAAVGPLRMMGRTPDSGRRRLFPSLTRVTLSAVQRVAAIRLHGQRLGAALGQAWTQTRNAREVADIQAIQNHWTAGRHEEARALAREAFDRHRGRFWRAVRGDAALRAIFTDAGMVVPAGGNRPPVYMDPVTGDQLDFMSLEHQTRLADDPTLALDAANLQTVLGDENSVMLEWIRRNDPFQ